MAVTTVAQFAAELNRPAATLLEQLQSAGVRKVSTDDQLTDADKERLLGFLRTSHGNTGGDRKKITLTRKSTSEIKQADSTGKARTIQVEVRKKRTFIKRDDAPAGEEAGAPAPVDEALELQRREEEAQQQAEQLRRQEEELAEKRRQREEQERAEREAAEARAREAAEKAAAEAAAAKAAAEAAAAAAKA
ncbi:MAG: translation initiation factor IF-2 associated domain-containing protein, partial [Aquincola tertiaricarbonis]